jgi:SAM-dependent methyltransferase
MLAPRTMPPSFAAWNRRHAAPAGRVLRGERILGKLDAGVRYRGPFAWQENSSTRAFEFPWVHQQVSAEGSSLEVLELGGGVAGLQFVLAGEGHRVTNVDPGVTPPEAVKSGADFSIDASRHERLCKVFKAPVNLVPKTIADAGFDDESFDVVLSVSALEHFTEESFAELYDHLGRVLRPGGLAVFTADVFLDLVPFTSREENRFGRNVDICELLGRCGLRLESGSTDQLLGFPDFDSAAIQRDLAEFLIGDGYPVMSQCFTARRKG